jgi:hypothetical protein
MNLGAPAQACECVTMLRHFLHDQLYGANYKGEILLENCPVIYGNVALHLSARATFFLPSDPSSISSMHHQMTRSNPSFHGCPCFDTVLVKTGKQDGFAGMAIACVFAFLVLKHEGVLLSRQGWYPRVGGTQGGPNPPTSQAAGLAAGSGVRGW